MISLNFKGLRSGLEGSRNRRNLIIERQLCCSMSINCNLGGQDGSREKYIVVVGPQYTHVSLTVIPM